MDAMEKALAEDLAKGIGAATPRTNGNPTTLKTVRLSEQIDTLIGDFELRIAMLKKIKESL
jgi:hypothetical protein